MPKSKKEKADITKISLNVPTPILRRVEKLADQAGMDKSRLLVNMIDETSKSLEFSGKVGILQFSVLIRNLGEKMDEWANAMKSKKIDLP